MSPFGIHGMLVILAVVYALLRDSRQHSIPLLVIVLLGIYLSAGSASLFSYNLVPHQPRYFLTDPRLLDDHGWWNRRASF